MRLVYDTELNGLYYEATELHCIVAKDLDIGKIYRFTSADNNLCQGIKLLEEANELVAHNQIDYDLRVLKKLYPSFKPQGLILDTMIFSQLLYPERPGGHSLQAFGEKYGIKKPEHEDWSRFSPEMLHRCTEDVKINHRVYEELMSEAYEDVRGIEYHKVFTNSL